MIYTANLGPCRGVVAELTNGNFALYHAGYKDFKEDFNEFVAAIKDNVNRIFVFQKRDNQINFLKAPLLAAELAIALKKDVQRVEISGYSAIVCDSKTKEVLVIPAYGFKTKPTTPDNPIGIVADKLSSLENAISSAIPIEQTYQEVINYKGIAGQGLYVATAARIRSHLSSQSSTKKIDGVADDKKASTGLWLRFRQYLNPSKSNLPVATNPTLAEGSIGKEKKARDILKIEPATSPKPSTPNFEKNRVVQPSSSSSSFSTTISTSDSTVSFNTLKSPASLSGTLGLHKSTPPSSTQGIEPTKVSITSTQFSSPSNQFIT